MNCQSCKAKITAHNIDIQIDPKKDHEIHVLIECPECNHLSHTYVNEADFDPVVPAPTAA